MAIVKIRDINFDEKAKAIVKVTDIYFDAVDIQHLVENRVSDELLTEVLSDRGYWIFEQNPNDATPLNLISFDAIVDWMRDHDFRVTYPGDSDEVDRGADSATAFDKWIQVQTEMDRLDLYSDSAKIGILSHVVGSLLDLIQPASVRTARTNTEAKEK